VFTVGATRWTVMGGWRHTITRLSLFCFPNFSLDSIYTKLRQSPQDSWRKI